MLRTGASVPAYPGPDGRPLPVGVVGCVAWSADGSRLFVGVQGGDPFTYTSTSARLFDVEGSVARNALPAAVGDLQAATYLVPHPTDDLVFLTDKEWVMRNPAAPSAWLRAACGVADRDLTRSEW